MLQKKVCYSFDLESKMLSFNGRSMIIGVKLVLLMWGITNLLQCAAISFVVNGTHQDAQTTFLNLTYLSVFLCALWSFLSSAVAGIALGVSAVAALIVLFVAQPFGGETHSLVMDVALRPALTSVLFILVSRLEKRIASEPS